MSIGPYGDGSFGTQEFSSSPFYTTPTLIDAILQNTGHSTPSQETAKRIVALNFINNRYSLISTSQHWDWLYQEVDFLFKEPYSTGTLTLTKGSQTVIGVGTAWSVNVTPNNTLYIPTLNQTYLILSVESSTSLTLEAAFAGEDATEVPYFVLKNIYTMPSDLENVQSLQIDTVGELIPLGRQELVRLKQDFTGQTNPPRVFTEIARRSDGVRLIEVYPSPERNYTGRLHYGVNISKLADETDDVPLIPDRHRAVLYYGGLADMYAYLRDSTMSAKFEDLFQLAVLNMRNDTKITDSKIQFQPARNYRNNGRRRFRRSISASDFARED